VDDIGKVFDSEPGAVVVPNPNLAPEYAYNAEAGFGQVFRENIRFEVTGYITLLNNAMIRRDDSFNGMDSILYDGTLSRVQAIQNASSSLIFGTQIGLEAVLLKNWNVSARINLQKGTDRLENETNSPTRHAVPLFGTVNLQRNFKNWDIMFYTNFSGMRTFENMPLEEIGKPHLYAKDENGNPYSPGWYTLNLKGSYQFKKIFRLNMGIENISNQRYRTYSSGLASPGINVITSLNITF
jgi:hemoglobin/transferrin/lactoferrin receptor protein